MGRKNKINDYGIGIKPCPICGKQPKTKSDGAACVGWYVQIQCKPLFGEPHLKVEVGKAYQEFAERTAINEWNRKADFLWKKRLYRS